MNGIIAKVRIKNDSYFKNIKVGAISISNALR